MNPIIKGMRDLAHRKPWADWTLSEQTNRLKFLFVATLGCIGDLAWRVQREGHTVRYWIKEPKQQDVCDGFLDKVKGSWRDHVEWADVIVFDDEKFGADADKLRAKGKLVVGGSAYTDKLELERDFGQDEMDAAGIKTVHREKFDDYGKAISYVRKNPKRYVLKPSGDIQDVKELLYVGKEDDGSDTIEVLQRYKKSWGSKIQEFVLQDFVKGVEVAAGALFNGTKFVMPLNINFEHKKMFPGDLGPSTGEMGTTMFCPDSSPIFDATLKRMESRLARARYVGYIDINCIVNETGIYPLEFTSRFGYPHISIWMEGIEMPYGEMLHDLAAGKLSELKTKDEFIIGVVLAVPPFPFPNPKTWDQFTKGSTITFDDDPEKVDWIHLGEVKLEDDEWTMAGEQGYALVITASGSTMKKAREKVYKRVERVHIPNMFYRNDIGERWGKDVDQLTIWGML
jgi:phosphoribosylamine--glycine ligase